MAFSFLYDRNTAIIGNNVTVLTPTCAVGDILIALVFENAVNSFSATLPGAFTNVASIGPTINFPSVTWGIRIVDGSEAGSYTFSGSAGNKVGYIVCISGANNQGTGYDAYDAGAPNNTGSTITISTGITPAVENELLLFITGSNQNTSVTSYAVTNNNPSWSTLFNDLLSNGGQDITSTLAYAVYSPTSATGAATASQGNVGYGAFLIGIKPAPVQVGGSFLYEMI